MGRSPIIFLAELFRLFNLWRCDENPPPVEQDDRQGAVFPQCVQISTGAARHFKQATNNEIIVRMTLYSIR